MMSTTIADGTSTYPSPQGFQGESARLSPPSVVRFSDLRSSAAVLAAVVSMTGVACSGRGSTGHPHQTSLVGIAPGAVHLDLLANGIPMIYWQYAVIPQAGEVRVTSEARFHGGKEEIPSEFDQPTGAIDACWKNPASISPDAKYVARCLNEFDRGDQFSVVNHDAFIVETRPRAPRQSIGRWKNGGAFEGFLGLLTRPRWRC